MSFQNQVNKELASLSLTDQRAFGWRCAVRALPFLAGKGQFNFWEKKDIQRHLLNVFNALDFASSDAFYVSTSSYASSKAAFASSDAAVKAIHKSGAQAAQAAAAAAYAGSDAYASIGAVVASVGYEKSEEIILQDLKNIKQGKLPQISIETYGIVWENFYKALKDHNCEYWGKWYKNLFENNFEFDPEEVKRRLELPKEIKKQGAARVATYMEGLDFLGGKRLNESRLIILGDKGAGKTCVARRLVDPEADMTTQEESTAGVDTSVWELEDDDMNVRIWDFAGHTVTHAVHQFFLSERCLYILVYNGRTEDTSRLEYWLDHMKNYGGNSQAIILVNERDRHRVEIPFNSLKEKYPILDAYYFNVKTDKKSMEKFRMDVVEYIKNNPSWKNQQIPTNYYHVKEDLENLFQKNEEQEGAEHIKKDVFVSIAKKHDVDNPEQLLKDLHALGVSLWYKNMEKYDTLILNPEWISNGVYKIINWVNGAKKHSLSLADFPKVFETIEKRYPKDKHEFLFNLIKEYELAFESTKGKRLIIPHLLKEDQPADLPTFKSAPSLMMRYVAEGLLPPNTISRFIVRHNEQIQKVGKQLQVWKYGVILEDGNGSLALVREQDGAINISVKGADKTNYITEIRSTLNSIFDSYVSQHPELKYKVVSEHVAPDQDLLLSEQEIVALHHQQKPYYYYKTQKDIPMGPVMITYNITNQNTYVIERNQAVYLESENSSMAANPNSETSEVQKLKAENKKLKEQRLAGYIKKQLFKWRLRSSYPFVWSLLLIITFTFILLEAANWDGEAANQQFLDWQKHIGVLVGIFIGLILLGFTRKMFYDCWFSQSQIQNFKKNLEIPEELR